MTIKKAQRTKAELLEAARELLLEEGIARLSMDRVAERAGVSKGRSCTTSRRSAPWKPP